MTTIAVCSWSLKPASVSELIDTCRVCGVSAVQLGLDPLRKWEWRPDEVGSRLRVAGMRVVSGMMAFPQEDYSTLETIKATGGIRPEAAWGENQRVVEGDALAALRLSLPLVSFHAGFLPHEREDAERGVMIGRLRQIAESYAARNIRVALETGQESAATLLEVLDEINDGLPPRARVGVNFDPANMILYGMGDPVQAVRVLMPHVRQVHVKDAVPARHAGAWGEEVPVGVGAVDWKAFFGVLKDGGYAGNFVIEREAGENRAGDVIKARELIETMWR